MIDYLNIMAVAVANWRTFLFGQSRQDIPIERVLDARWPWSMWLTILLALGLTIAITSLYFSERGKSSQATRAFLALLRISILVMVLWMLAGWYWLRFQSDQPELVILLDRSGSMQTRDIGLESSRSLDGVLPSSSNQSRWEQVQSQLTQVFAQQGVSLSQRYRLRFFTVAADTSNLSSADSTWTKTISQVEPDGEQSRLGDGLLKILQQQIGVSTAAIVLVSDGMVTSGTSLKEAGERARAAAIPIYTLGVGSQLPHPDLQIVDVLADNTVFVGDRVIVQTTISASDIQKKSTEVVLRELPSGKVLDSQSIELTNNQSQYGVQLSYVPTSTGSNLLQIEAKKVSGETDIENNLMEHTVEVRDQTLRILLVSQLPSFEFRFLKTLLERTEQLGSGARKAFELQSVLQEADADYVSQDPSAIRLIPSDPATLSQYDVFVFAGFDPSLVSKSTQQLIADEVTQKGSGFVFICHPQLDVRKLAGHPIATLLPVSTKSLSPLPTPVGDFHWQPTNLGSQTLPLRLSLQDSSTSLWERLPGSTSLATFAELKSGAQILANTRVPGSSDDAPPMLISQFAGAGRVVLQATDETYRWTNFQGSDAIYQRYWVQMLRWLSRGRYAQSTENSIRIDPKRAQLGAPVQINVQLDNETIAKLGENACQILLENAKSGPIKLDIPRFSNSPNRFKLSYTGLPAGTYKASLESPKNTQASSTTLTITSPPGEQANLRADLPALRQLAAQSRGEFAYSDSASQLFQKLPPGVSSRRGALPPEPLWNAPWVAMTFVLLLTAEWLLRRRANMV